MHRSGLLTPFAVMRSGTVEAAMLLVLLSCDGVRKPKDAFQSAADSIQRRAAGWTCQPSSLSPIRDAIPPFTACSGTVGDTAVAVMYDSSGTALEYVRSWTPAPESLQASFARVATRMERDFHSKGSGWCGDTLAIQNALVWRSPQSHTILGLRRTQGSILLSVTRGSPYCDPDAGGPRPT